MKMPRYFYSVTSHSLPIDSSVDKFYEISIDDINYFALFSTTLNPSSEITEFAGYAAALEDYYFQNKDKYSETYTHLTSSGDGKRILCTSIQLVLLEKEFRNYGINGNSLKLYEKYINDYQRQIEHNQLIYAKYAEDMHDSNKTL